MIHPSRNAFLLASAATLVAGLLLPGTANAAPTASGPAQHVIVMLKNQHSEVPATHGNALRRIAVTDADQSRLVAAARAAGATGVKQLHVINAFAIAATPAEQARLRSDSSVAEVVPDRQIQLKSTPTVTPALNHQGVVSSTTCPSSPTKPLLEPEALQLTHDAFADPSTPSAQKLATGKGVKVAFLADGLDVNNPDFIRADGSHVFVDYKDFSGDGPLAPTASGEAFGDASAIAAQGRQVYDLANYVNPAHPLPAGCTIRIRGMAPDASLVGLKVFPAGGFAFNSAILAALDYAATVDKVDVINESFGSNQYPDTNDDPTAVFNAQLVAAGITITASSGDAGGENTVGSPASEPGVISVGATTSFRSYAQTTESGFQLSNGKYQSDNISGLSSSGVTQTGRTIDLVAPGDLGWALCTPDPDIWQDCTDNKGAPSNIQEFGGSSQSAPLTAGAAALVIQAYRDTHGGSSPTPALVKQLLTGTASDLDLPAGEQGAGLLNAYRAVQAARSVENTKRAGNSLIANMTQLDVTTVSGRSTTATVKVTNVGSKPQLLQPSLRSAGREIRGDDFSVTLSPSTDPTFVDGFGTLRAYRAQKFSVPAGASRLTAAAAWPGNGTRLVRIILLDPSGTYSAFSLPQGVGSYAFVDVQRPKSGTWTAILYTGASAAGFAGPVDFRTTSYADAKIGSVFPSVLLLKPGQTANLRVTVPAGDKGDVVDGLQLTPPSRPVAGLIPVVVRTLVANTHSGGTFAGSFTGGNARAGIPSPSRTYAFDVPNGRKDLAVSVTVRGDAGQQLYGFLVDPNGEPVNERTNVTLGSDGTGTLTRSLQFDHRSPQAGRWLFVFTVFGPIAGTSVVTSYTGQISYGLAAVKAAGLPTSAKTVLRAGVPATATVTVTNNGAAPTDYYADGRLSGRQNVALIGSNTTGYPLDPAPLPPFPAFVVPTGTDELTVRGTSDRPINFEASPFPADHVTDLAFEGDPDVEAGPAGTSPVLNLDDPIIAPQTWLMLPSQIGPFADTAPKATTSFTAVAHTHPFDPAVTSTTGDPQLAAVTAGAPAATPLALTPGSSGTITVTVIPAGPKGHVVRGTLFVNTIDPVTGSSDETVALPYTYTIG